MLCMGESSVFVQKEEISNNKHILCGSVVSCLFACLIVHGFFKQFLVKDPKYMSSVHSGYWMLGTGSPMCRIQEKGLSQCSELPLPPLHAEMNADGCGVPQKSVAAEAGACRGWQQSGTCGDSQSLSPCLGQAVWFFNLCSSCICKTTSLSPVFTSGTLSSTALSLYLPPGMPLQAFWAFWACGHPWSSSFCYVDWTSICLTTIAALSLVAMSCQLLGGRRKWAIVRMILSCQLEQRAWVAPPSPFVSAFWFFPALETARHFQNVFAFKEWGASVYLDKSSWVKFSANQTNVCICSYKACGKGKTVFPAEAWWCLFAHWYWLSSFQQVSLSQKASDKHWSGRTPLALSGTAC